MSTTSSQSVQIEGFGDRLREAFKGASNKEIADKLDISESAVTNYMKGRVTLPLLIQVTDFTGCSFDWLITGTAKGMPSDIEQAIDQRVRLIVREELALITDKKQTLPLEVGQKESGQKRKSA